MHRAVFLDRDGVLIEDVHLLTRSEDIHILDGVPRALNRLHSAGFRLIVVSLQTVVARGMLTESEVSALQHQVECRLEEAGAPHLDGFYFCPHHPGAALTEYRIACNCRKPRPGLLLKASAIHRLSLEASFMVGDRITDVLAGTRAGCRTVWVQTGMHLAPPIQTPDAIAMPVEPDHVCGNLEAATEWILSVR